MTAAIPTITNFRDFGGYEVASGGRTTTGRLFRSGHFAKLKDDAVNAVLSHNFSVITDLRHPPERAREVSPWPADWAERVLTHEGQRQEGDAPHLTLVNGENGSVEAVDIFYDEMYRDLPYNDLYAPLFARTLIEMSERGGPLLIHCTMGKDRTGVLAALIHAALGVRRDDIMADFLATRDTGAADYLAPKLAQRYREKDGVPADDALVHRLLSVREEYLNALWDEIEKRSGSIDAYFDSVGVTDAVRAGMRANYVKG